jgi:hypothetical protein
MTTLSSVLRTTYSVLLILLPAAEKGRTVTLKILLMTKAFPKVRGISAEAHHFYSSL